METSSFPDRAGGRSMHGTYAFWPSLLDHWECARVGVGDMAVQTQIAPAMTFGVEGSLLSRLEACDLFRVGGEKFLVFASSVKRLSSMRSG